MKFLWVAISFALARAGDLSDDLAAESTADSSASEKAECWCNDFQEELSAREREAESQLNYFESSKTAQHFENEALRMEVSEHLNDVDDHQQALDAGTSVHEEKLKAYEEERAFHENAIESVRKAMNALPPGAGGEVRGALRGLEETFSSKMQDAQDEHDSSMQDLLDSKANMLRLAKSAASMKQQRLAKGVADVERSSARIAAYNAQREADSTLGSALHSLCNALTTRATEREKLRQQALIAFSQANADAAAANARRYASNMVLLKHTSHLRTAHGGGKQQSKKALRSITQIDSDLKDIVARSDKVRSDMFQVLNGVVTNANQWAAGHLDTKVQKALEDLADATKSDVEALPHLFDSVRSAGVESLRADEKVQAAE